MIAEYALFEERGVVRVPDHLNFEEAATLPCAAVTAWNALKEAGTEAGTTVLLQGTGRRVDLRPATREGAGARALITSSSDEKLSRAQGIGADAGITTRPSPTGRSGRASRPAASASITWSKSAARARSPVAEGGEVRRAHRADRCAGRAAAASIRSRS